MTFCNVLVTIRPLSAENASKMLNRRVSKTGNLACGSVEDGVAIEGTLFDSGMALPPPYGLFPRGAGLGAMQVKRK